jgi:hypothetical protein
LYLDVRNLRAVHPQAAHSGGIRKPLNEVSPERYLEEPRRKGCAMSDTNSPYVAPVVDQDEFADDPNEVDEVEETQLGGETMSDGKVPVDGDTMSNNDELEAHDGDQ